MYYQPSQHTKIYDRPTRNTFLNVYGDIKIWPQGVKIKLQQLNGNKISKRSLSI